LYIDDLIDAIFLTFRSSKARGEVINIGYGFPLKIKNIINKIVSIYKLGNPLFNKIKLRKEERMKIYPNLNKAKKLIKWKAKTNFSKGLKKTIKYYNAN
jgi:nucleoside-diphosphate-sugar epimerase